MNVQQYLSLILTLIMLMPASAQQAETPPPAALPQVPRIQITQAKKAAQPAGRKSRGKTLLQAVTPLVGQSTTLLPDAETLTIGGSNVAGVSARIVLGQQILASTLNHARAWHTGTVLPDGTVFVFGGVDTKGLVADAEIFDPSTQKSQVTQANLLPRAYHTATLLTDGRLLIVGGVDSKNTPLDSIELWDPKKQVVQVAPAHLAQARKGHTATLQGDGNVRIEGGVTSNGTAASKVELFNPDTLSLVELDSDPAAASDLLLAASLPGDGSRDVDLTSLIALRFTRVLDMKTITTATITLRDQVGPVAARVSGAEGGILAFVSAQGGLQLNSTYTVSVSGAMDKTGLPVPPVEFSFTTGTSAVPPTGSSPVGVSTGGKEDPILAPLTAPAGVTALSGQVHTVTGKILPGVAISLNCGESEANWKSAKSDNTGRFLITGLTVGHCEMKIDGSTAQDGKNVYGEFYPGVDIAKGVTTVLPYVIWMTPLDMAHAVSIPSPTSSEFVVSNPTLPGLELHLPAKTTITDYDGKVIKRLSITQIPVGRPPFPLPSAAAVPLYFTVQPGGAYITVAGNPSQGARLFYPNQMRAPAGAKMSFWNYDPDGKGWYVYGTGTVDANRKQIVPDPGTYIYRLTGAMVAGPPNAPPYGPPPGKPIPPMPDGPPGCPPDCPIPGGDPVDPSTGLFTYGATDFRISDVLPLTLTRSYRQGDPVSHAFGIGMNHNYDIYLIGDTFPYTYVDLISSEGSRTHYSRTSSGTGFTDAVYQTTAVSSLYNTQIAWNGAGWNLTLKDGTILAFLDGFGATSPTQGALSAVTDRSGNKIAMTRDATTGNLLRVISPNGRYVAFTYDSSNRVTKAVDNSGRSYTYAYDAGGRLVSVTDPMSGVTQYTYDANNQMLTLVDPRENTYVTNQYDASGRVIQQTMADGGTWQFAYTQDANGNIIQTNMTNPRGFVERLAFNTNGYFSGGQAISDTRALGQPEQQMTTFSRDVSTGLLQSITDPLQRVNTFTYDPMGNLLSVVLLAGTNQAATTTYTYSQRFNQVTTTTDPLGHTTTFTYDNAGNLTMITDPLSNQTTLAYNASGLMMSATTPPIGTFSFTTLNGSTTAITDPGGHSAKLSYDAIGRVIATSDDLGPVMTLNYDPLSRIVGTSDALQDGTKTSYDANGNILAQTNANNETVTFTPDVMNRTSSYLDPLFARESYTYDANGNLTQRRDRAQQITAYSYDSQDRLSSITFNDGSVISYVYDAGNRLLQEIDSISGTIYLTYDSFDHIILESSSQGSVGYAYDSAGRMVTMSIAGEATINYTYDVSDRLTQISQGSAIITIAYDAAGRRNSVALPNGVVLTYGYDTSSRVNSLSYTMGAALIGNLTYAYDAAGRIVGRGGSLASTALPPSATASYNSADQITQWNGTLISYDANGSMLSDGTNTFSWNSRNELALMSGGSVSASFQYDAADRRIGKTINGTTTGFLFAGLNIAQELAGGTPIATYLAGLSLDETFIRTDSSGSHFFLSDNIGSIVAETDATGAIRSQYQYEPFGATSISGANSPNPLQFSARENDGTGLYYLRARYYSPRLQRFISQDPLGAEGNGLYTYAENNPLSFFDPLGLFAHCFYSVLGNSLWCSDPDPGGLGPPWNPVLFGPVPAYSGNNNDPKHHCAGNPDCQFISGIGPIPKGKYPIQPPEFLHNGKYPAVRLGQLSGSNRNGLLIHQGDKPSPGYNPRPWSTGCVVTPAIQRLLDWLAQHGWGDLTVF